MEKEKDIYTVKTSAPEAVLITLVTIFCFLCLVFMLLLPYTGKYMHEAMSGKKTDTEENETVITETTDDITDITDITAADDDLSQDTYDGSEREETAE